jgi:hypothetical protein
VSNRRVVRAGGTHTHTRWTEPWSLLRTASCQTVGCLTLTALLCCRPSQLQGEDEHPPPVSCVCAQTFCISCSLTHFTSPTHSLAQSLTHLHSLSSPAQPVFPRPLSHPLSHSHHLSSRCCCSRAPLRLTSFACSGSHVI